ncbi:MAG TPA: hypothetical protein VG738_02300 [Chitinophagaceae bacterium]|nr:hypothetical protein [Chitinophagaceae bacterium]
MPKAIADIRSIRYWYGEQKVGLGDDFFKEVLTILDKVEKNPTAFRYIKRKSVAAKRQGFHITFTIRLQMALPFSACAM